jgi:hypothetical protein
MKTTAFFAPIVTPSSLPQGSFINTKALKPLAHDSFQIQTTPASLRSGGEFAVKADALQALYETMLPQLRETANTLIAAKKRR